MKENVFHINNRKACFRKPLNYLRQNNIYCRNNEYKRYEFINTTDMDSMISSVSFNDYQFALDCMNTSESSGSSRSSSAPPQPPQTASKEANSSARCHIDERKRLKSSHNLLMAKNLLTNSKKNCGGQYILFYYIS